MDIISGDVGSPLVKSKFEIRFRGYCESCGTMDLHGSRCAACGFNFEMTSEPSSRWAHGNKPFSDPQVKT
ncbi:protein of unknown function [Beijerinckiaceae bacterium RH AL1]|nr:protein of unknown function [Beijerinckiaceae bacterium RH CH11]VVB47598.1 protein of unknown function [Beijerinckiaceae bacterium RH AL8]VVC55928.1 protein of unknown function [Beijerinckiaceae bacterium RH AL1]